MSKDMNLQSLFCGILLCISVAALVIACLAFTKKGGGNGEYYDGSAPTGADSCREIDTDGGSWAQYCGARNAYKDYAGCIWTGDQGAGHTNEICTKAIAMPKSACNHYNHACWMDCSSTPSGGYPDGCAGTNRVPLVPCCCKGPRAPISCQYVAGSEECTGMGGVDGVECTVGSSSCKKDGTDPSFHPHSCSIANCCPSPS